MSVAIIIDYPSDIDYYLPVSTERFFNEYWQKAIDEYKMSYIGNGILINRDQLSLFLDELQKMKQWVYKNEKLNQKENQNQMEYILERIGQLEVEIPKLFKNEKIKTIWMG